MNKFLDICVEIGAFIIVFLALSFVVAILALPIVLLVVLIRWLLM